MYIIKSHPPLKFLFPRLVAVLCAFSLTAQPIVKHLDTLAPKSNTIERQNGSEPLTLAFLRQAEDSPDQNQEALAELILAEQRLPISGLKLSLLAALFSTFPYIGQEILLKKITTLDLLFLQPLVMTGVNLVILLRTAKERFFYELKLFFPILWKSGTFKWFVIQLISHQIIRNALFFYFLPKIGSAGVSMIAAVTVIFTPVLEWLLLGQNKIKPSYVACYFLIFFGVIGYKFTSLPGPLLITLALVHYALASFETIAKKKILMRVNGAGLHLHMPLVMVSWSYFLSFLIWIGVWVVASNSGILSQPSWLIPSSAYGLMSTLTSAWVFVLVATVTSLSCYRLIEAKTLNIPAFPAAVQESLLQTRILITALLVTGITILSAHIPVLNQFQFQIPKIQDWIFFIPLILSGVFLLSYNQNREDLIADEDKKVYGPKGRMITRQDWKEMLLKMRKSRVRDADFCAKRAWELHFNFNGSNGKKKTVIDSATPSLLAETSL